MIEDFKIDEVVDIEPNMKNIKVPVLLLTGDKDVLVYPEYSYSTQKLIGDNCKVKEYANFMHMLPLANKEEIAKDIVDFVESI